MEREGSFLGVPPATSCFQGASGPGWPLVLTSAARGLFLAFILDPGQGEGMSARMGWDPVGQEGLCIPRFLHGVGLGPFLKGGFGAPGGSTSFWFLFPGSCSSLRSPAASGT